MTTTYTAHDARDHSVVATFGINDDTVEVLTKVAEAFKDQGTRRFYIHNGAGVVSALLARDGKMTQILRDDYIQFSAKGRNARAECGINS